MLLTKSKGRVFFIEWIVESRIFFQQLNLHYVRFIVQATLPNSGFKWHKKSKYPNHLEMSGHVGVDQTPILKPLWSGVTS